MLDIIANRQRKHWISSVIPHCNFVSAIKVIEYSMRHISTFPYKPWPSKTLDTTEISNWLRDPNASLACMPSQWACLLKVKSSKPFSGWSFFFIMYIIMTDCELKSSLNLIFCFQWRSLASSMFLGSSSKNQILSKFSMIESNTLRFALATLESPPAMNLLNLYSFEQKAFNHISNASISCDKNRMSFIGDIFAKSISLVGLHNQASLVEVWEIIRLSFS